MKKILIALFAFSIVLAGCSASGEKVSKKTAKVLEEYADDEGYEVFVTYSASKKDIKAKKKKAKLADIEYELKFSKSYTVFDDEEIVGRAFVVEYDEITNDVEDDILEKNDYCLVDETVIMVYGEEDFMDIMEDLCDDLDGEWDVL